MGKEATKAELRFMLRKAEMERDEALRAVAWLSGKLGVSGDMSCVLTDEETDAAMELYEKGFPDVELDDADRRCIKPALKYALVTSTSSEQVRRAAGDMLRRRAAVEN